MSDPPSEERLDVAIVTAVAAEWEAVLSVETGARAGTSWEPRKTKGGFEMRVREFEKPDGGLLRIGVIQALGMGSTHAANAAWQMLDYEPRCLAMCGVCAGSVT